MITEPLNRNAFIRIYNSGSGDRLPVAGMKELNRTSPALIFVPQESYSIYVNAVVTQFLLIGGSATYDIGADLIPVVVTGGTHTIIEFTLPNIPEGVYLGDLGGGSQSNPVEVIKPLSEAKIFSAFFEFSHNSILGTFYYPYAPEGYEQKIRMRCWMKDKQSEDTFTNYRETNTGRMQSLAGTLQEYVMFETPDFDIDDHGAARILSLHDNIKVNGRLYHRKETSSYKVSLNQDTPLSPGEFGLYDTASTILLRC